MSSAEIWTDSLDDGDDDDDDDDDDDARDVISPTPVQYEVSTLKSPEYHTDEGDGDGEGGGGGGEASTYLFKPVPSHANVEAESSIGEKVKADEISLFVKYGPMAVDKFPTLYQCTLSFRTLRLHSEADDIREMVINNLKTCDFLNACTQLYQLLCSLPRRWGFDPLARARSDVKGNLDALKKTHAENEDDTDLLFHLPQYNRQKLVWLVRGTRFIAALLTNIACRSRSKLSECAREAYKDTLEQYHNKVMKRIASMSLSYVITREEFLGSVSNRHFRARDAGIADRTREDPGTYVDDPLTPSEMVIMCLSVLAADLKLVSEHIDTYIAYHDKIQSVSEEVDRPNGLNELLNRTNTSSRVDDATEYGTLELVVADGDGDSDDYQYQTDDYDDEYDDDGEFENEFSFVGESGECTD